MTEFYHIQAGETLSTPRFINLILISRYVFCFRENKSLSLTMITPLIPLYWPAVNICSYAENATPTRHFGFTADYSDDRNWHSIKHFSHFFLGTFFVIFAFLFTFRFWEIVDYSNTNLTSKWLSIYSTGKYWRLGGMRIMFRITQGCIVLLLWIFFIYSLSKEFTSNSVPESRIIGENFPFLSI